MPPASSETAWLRKPSVIAAVVLTAAFAFVFVDRPLIFAVAHWPAAGGDLFEIVTGLGHSRKYIVGSALAFVLFRWVVRRPRGSAAAALVFGAIVFPGMIVNVLKVVIGRVRPHRLIEAQHWGFDPFTFDYDTSSFPSGHSSTIFGLAFALGLLFPRWRVPFFALALLVGLSRVAILAHYPSDVIVGAYVGVAVSATWAAWLQRKNVHWRREASA